MKTAWKKPDPKDHTAYNPTDEKRPEQADPQRQEARYWLLGDGVRGMESDFFGVMAML